MVLCQARLVNVVVSYFRAMGRGGFMGRELTARAFWCESEILDFALVCMTWLLVGWVRGGIDGWSRVGEVVLEMIGEGLIKGSGAWRRS